jgi:hypothetical protein
VPIGRAPSIRTGFVPLAFESLALAGTPAFADEGGASFLLDSGGPGAGELPPLTFSITAPLKMNLQTPPAGTPPAE